MVKERIKRGPFTFCLFDTSPLVQPRKYYSRMIMSSRFGPVPMYPILIPSDVSIYSTYLCACNGRSDHVRTPLVELCQPGKSIYSTVHFSRRLKSAGKLVSFSPLAVQYATATRITGNVSSTSSLVKLMEV